MEEVGELVHRSRATTWVGEDPALSAERVWKDEDRASFTMPSYTLATQCQWSSASVEFEQAAEWQYLPSPLAGRPVALM